MARYFFNFAGREQDRAAVECDTIDEARNAAVRHLGSYLASHPGFASEGHWRVSVEDEFGQPFLHVVVATVNARRPADRA